MSSKIIVLIAICLINVHLGSAASCHVPVTTPASCQPPVTTPTCQPPVTYPPVTVPPTTTPACVAPVTYPPQVTLPPVTLPPTTTPGCVAPVTFPPVTVAPVTVAPVTVAPVTYVPTTTPDCVEPVTSPSSTPAADLPDKVVIVTNKGGYTAGLGLSYIDPLTNEPVTQTGSILSGQSYAFYVPGAVDYTSEVGARLNVFAIAGKQVIDNYKVTLAKQCIHVWGTTLYPAWSPIDC